ncbi:zinc-binding dehydrogenase, partial [Pseudomonas sp. H11T01]|uniref:zinc-binding dehydrogenase n=1 Tax=Pseudomonas sp. H11T01 TaxID=3402749 RepID=UPI003ACD8F5B
EIDFFDFGVGTHHEVRAPEKNREHSIGDQVAALNVGFMERLRNVATLVLEGRLVMLGLLGSDLAKDIDLMAIKGKRASVTGSLLRDHGCPVLDAGRCLPMIDKVYPYTEAAQAHARIEGGDHISKIVLRVD